MATKTRTLGPGTLKITDSSNGKDFSADLTKVALTPNVDNSDPVTYLDGSEEVDAKVTWTLEGTIGEDFSEEGLQIWCMDHAGEKLAAEFIPRNDAKLKFTMDVTITPVGFGGEVKSRNTHDFTFSASNVKHMANTPG